MTKEIKIDNKKGGKRMNTDLRRVLRGLLGRTVTVSTDFAPVTGILSAIQVDYIVINEAAGTVVFVPVLEINSVREPI